MLTSAQRKEIITKLRAIENLMLSFSLEIILMQSLQMIDLSKLSKDLRSQLIIIHSCLE